MVMKLKYLTLAISLGMLALSACTASVTTYGHPDGYYDRYGYYHRY
jgi:hypothetical protein